MELRDSGTNGPPIVFLHGLLVDGSLWDAVVERLPERRCIVLELPLGSHTVPAPDRSQLTPFGVADMIAAELARLDLQDVVLVGNDTGGGLAQLVVTRHPERIGKLVLTPCDALEVFPPALFKPLFWAGRFPPLLSAFLQPMRWTPVKRLPIAFGWLTKRAPDELLARWGTPALNDGEILRDAAHFAVHADHNLLLDAATKLRRFEGEVVIAWPPEDKCFPIALGRRLAAQFRAATFVEVDDSYSFVPVDRPDVLAPLL
jgi:pimeloyl-ACP methyl ester carboxylesterase